MGGEKEKIEEQASIGTLDVFLGAFASRKNKHEIMLLSSTQVSWSSRKINKKKETWKKSTIFLLYGLLDPCPKFGTTKNGWLALSGTGILPMLHRKSSPFLADSRQAMKEKIEGKKQPFFFCVGLLYLSSCSWGYGRVSSSLRLIDFLLSLRLSIV